MSRLLKPIGEKKDGFNNIVAVMVAVVSACLAVANIKNGNIAQSAQNEQRAAASSWNQYQAKRLRQFALDMRLQDYAARTSDASYMPPPALVELVERWRAKEIVYRAELKDLATRARAHEKRQKLLSLMDDDFDVAEALLTLTLALLAIAALTRNQAMLGLGMFTGGISIFFAVVAFGGWSSIHPSWVLGVLGV